MGFWLVMLLVIPAIVLYCLLARKPGMQREYRDKQQGLADLLRYATPVDDGVMLTKGGELMAGFFYRGTDTESASNHELEGIAANLTRALNRFGDGWMVHIDAIRGGAVGYPEEGAFAAPVAQLMDSERRYQYNEAAGSGYFESMYALVFTYRPPRLMEARAKSMMFEHSADVRASLGELHDQIIAKFLRDMQDLEAQLSTVFEGIVRMRCHPERTDPGGQPVQVDDLISYLHYCVTGIRQGIVRPNIGLDADTLIASQDFYAGTRPRIGDKFIRVVAIEGFPAESYATILDALNTLPVAYRWSSRFIFMDAEPAKALIEQTRRKWKQKIVGFKDQVMNKRSGAIDTDALDMTDDAEAAIGEINAGHVVFGHYTSVVVLMGEDATRLEEAARECVKLITNLRFAARLEELNSIEAYLGSLPGHGRENVRRPLCHSLNLAHLMPTTATWPGLNQHPCPFYPKSSPPLFYAATSGRTPFRVSLHVGDLGHTLVLGPTGAGKSTLLEFIAASHLRYPKARVIKFEKGYSSFVLCHAVGGSYYDIGAPEAALNFCPLGQVDKPHERLWAEEYIETLLTLNGLTVEPAHRTLIRHALVSLGTMEPERRTMTSFVAQVQDADIQGALNRYTLSGGSEILDAEKDDIGLGRFGVLELEHLMEMKGYAVPVLLYLFHCIDRSLDGRPTLLILDEGWLMLDHPLFRDKLKTWLKVLRKANVAVVFATQSISDVRKSPIYDVIIDSCATTILLPNSKAREEASLPLYRALGLNERQIDLLAQATPKQDYYYLSALGRRMFRLGLGPMCLAFVGASGKEDIQQARALIAAHGRLWPVHWLHHCNTQKEEFRGLLGEWARVLEQKLREAA